MKEEQVKIEITESVSNTTVEIKSKPTSESHKTFRCYKNSEMSTSDQTIKLRKRIEKISQLTAPTAYQEKQQE